MLYLVWRRADILPEASLGQLDAVQARLAESERSLQHEIDFLQRELSKEQDSSRMQLIQEMISVSLCSHVMPSQLTTSSVGLARTNVTHSRESN